ncbi:hypothetical protein Hdeb2414_s0019g00545891 [Helianthus debilis subsp. tardiflorus]
MMIKSHGIFTSRMKSYGCEYIPMDFIFIFEYCLVKILCISLTNSSTHHASLTAIQGIRIAKVRGVSSSFVFVPKLEHASCYIIAVDMSMSSHKSKILSCLRTCLTIRLVIIIHCIPFQQAL